MRSIAADTDPDVARRAALALRLPDRIEHHKLHALQIAARLLPDLFELKRQAVLRPDILAAAALEHQAHVHSVFAPRLEVELRRPRPEVVARVLARDRVHGVLS